MLTRLSKTVTLNTMFVLISGNFLPRKPKILSVAVFTIADLEKVNTSYPEFVGMCMIYLHTKFHVPNSSNSSIVAIKPIGKYSVT
jgi:hypothetical protein